MMLQTNPSFAFFAMNKVSLVVFVILGFLPLCGQAELLDLYLSDGTLLDCDIIEGDTVEIDTGATPPLFAVDSMPFGYTYKGKVIDGAAVFSFNNVYIDPHIVITVVGDRPLVIAAKGDMECGAFFDVSAGVAGGGVGGIGGASGAGGRGGDGGSGGIGGAGGKGGAGGDANPEAEEGHDSEVGKGGGAGHSGSAGTAGLAGTETGSRGEAGYGNPEDFGGAGGSPGQSGGEAGQASTLVGDASPDRERAESNDGQGGKLVSNSRYVVFTYGLPGAKGSDGDEGDPAGADDVYTNATAGTSGESGASGAAPLFALDPATLLLAAGPGGGGGGGGA